MLHSISRPRKAFDLIWRKGVLQKLVQYGTEGNMLLWIQDFLSGRKIQVKLGTVLSDLRECLNESPQGAVLSLILCNLIINTLYEVLEALPIDLLQFADDSAIWKEVHSQTKSCTQNTTTSPKYNS